MGLLTIPLVAVMLALGGGMLFGGARAIYRAFEAMNDHEHGYPNNMEKHDILIHVLGGLIFVWLGGGTLYYVIVDTTYQLTGENYSHPYLQSIFGQAIGSVF